MTDKPTTEDEATRTGFLRVPVAMMPAIADFLEREGHAGAAGDCRSFMTQYTTAAGNKLREECLKLAEDQQAEDGELEFDSDMAISESDDGAYVMGWAWVSYDKDDEDEGED